MRISVGLTAAVLAALFLAPTAGAAPCIGGFKGSKCHVWNATVRDVDDGDTLTVRVAGAGMQQIRLNGVQAMELWNYKPNHRAGYCHAIAARTRLEQLVKGSHRHVRLYAQHKNSRSVGEARSRFRRTVAVKSDGRWIDTGSVLIREGHALWLPNGQEWAWNGPYSKLAQQAQRAHRRLWNPAACGAGPSQSSRLHMKVKWDAAGVDGKNINGEWVRITNNSPRKVSLRGWWLRDSYLRGQLHGRKKGRGYQFPKGAAIAPFGSIMVHAGRGRNSRTQLHWGLGDPPFENATADRIRAGDGAYLFDPDGDARSFEQWPCRLGCRDPLAGKVDVHATFRGTEFVTVRNTGRSVIDLSEYEIETSPYFYEFERGTTIQPQSELILYVGRSGGRGHGSTIVRHWGFSVGLLGDGSDAVVLRNPLGAPVDCDAWGRIHCPKA